MEILEQFISQAVQQQASDVHLVAGSSPHIRVNDQLQPISDAPFTQEQAQTLVKELLNEEQKQKLQERGDVDVGARVSETNLRINIHQQTKGLGFSIRLIAGEIPAPEQLNFTEPMLAVKEMTQGLVIVSGSTGSGKSTTIAALIESINQEQAKHIITLEDPIEYRYAQKKSVIEQRQLGEDFPSFPSGLKHVLRQDPDVIMVGEMRDHETISLALTAAETGHLVISTLHAPNAAEAVERIVNVFDGDEQQQILTQLSATLKMVIAQQLLPKAGGGRVASREIMVSTPAITNAIRQNNLSTIKSAISTGKKFGMMSMEQSIEELKKTGVLAEA